MPGSDQGHGAATVERIRKRFVEGGLEGVLTERPKPGGKRKLDGKAEASLIAWACSTPPDNRKQWSMQLLADKLIELKLVEAISDETVRRTLKKELKLWLKEEWCILTVSAAFVWRMEDVLDQYAEEYNPAYPVVCFDESPYQLVREVCTPLLPDKGQPRRYDYEYKREGSCNLFFQPLSSWRHVKVTERRTAKDYAQCMKELVDVHFPDAILIRSGIRMRGPLLEGNTANRL